MVAGHGMSKKEEPIEREFYGGPLDGRVETGPAAPMVFVASYQLVYHMGKMRAGRLIYEWEGLRRPERAKRELARSPCYKCGGAGWNHDGPDPARWYACGHCWSTGYHDATGKAAGDTKLRPSS